MATRMVEFRRAVLPYRPGQQIAVPDALAQKLVALGDAVIVPSVFDAPAASKPGRLFLPRQPRRVHTREAP